MHPIKEVLPLLTEPKKIFITTHHKPDGDAIGSMLALHHYLVANGHEVTSVSPSDLPEFLMWMPGVDLLYNYEAEQRVVEKALLSVDYIFCLDFNAYGRTGKLAEPLSKASQPKILIDHHLMPENVWDYGMSDPDKSSTCEMVYDFINISGDNKMITKDIATCIYTGTMTDTGSFRFPATKASVHSMIADLKEKGLEHSVIHEAIYDTWSLKRMQFLGYVLLERMEIMPEYNTGLIALSKKDIKLFDVNSGDMEGLVNYPLSIEGIRFAVLITERGEEVKLSLRSKGDFDVSKFSRDNFNGGGHFNAAGGRSDFDFTNTIIRFKEILSDIHPQ